MSQLSDVLKINSENEIVGAPPMVCEFCGKLVDSHYQYDDFGGGYYACVEQIIDSVVVGVSQESHANG